MTNHNRRQPNLQQTLTNVFGRERPVLPWAAVIVTSNRDHKRLVITASSPAVRQLLWPQMWHNFEDAVLWMQERPYVLHRWDREALAVGGESAAARADLERGQALAAERKRKHRL